MKNKQKYEKLVNDTLEDFFKHMHEMRIKEILEKAKKYHESVNV